MATLAFPMNLPGMDLATEVEPYYATQIAESVSGKEDRASWRSAYRIRYRMKFNFLRTTVNAPSPWAAYTEYAFIRYVVDTLKGSWDYCQITDPLDSTSRNARLVEDSVRFTEIVPTVWACELEFVTVL